MNFGNLVQRWQDEPLFRRFPRLGYDVLIIPIDLCEDRTLGRIMMSSLYNINVDEMQPLQARTFGGRPCWVYAIKDEVYQLKGKRG